ncbi:hypothetical protein HNY73_010869 [Argiope bruennichi]|uniref:Uncharacterized protein n=1 Tax=Argiope bruennichi TaxID=94029 RepID=A0A8T0F7B2_ARGBR|nr:hypothetical protein HNY73_010869 [Argiope bruennichi]
MAMIEKLKEKITTYANYNIAVDYEETPFVLAILTPNIKRSYCLPTSQETIFIDSTSSCNSESHSVIFMLGSCTTGACGKEVYSVDVLSACCSCSSGSDKNSRKKELHEKLMKLFIVGLEKFESSEKG